MAARASKAEVFGASWWAERLRLSCDLITSGTRSTTARTYVRQGRVLSWHLKPGQITAQVQGTEAWPYEVRIDFTVVDPNVTDAMATWFQEHRALALGILGGELPEAVELRLNELSASLFPLMGKNGWLPAEPVCGCSCFDFSHACKHAMAVIYTLCRDLDTQPLLLLKLRGLPLDDWLAVSVTQNLLAGPATPPGYYRSGDGWQDPSPLSPGVDPLTMLRALGPAPIRAGRKSINEPLAEAYQILASKAGDWLSRLAGRD
ncbi:MAG: hypothetical protein H7338_17310 [Candidatus Sericytochromatia bacterium]|nr:hypothetical protein [Candidatus Sericytochromatia bacterium]